MVLALADRQPDAGALGPDQAAYVRFLATALHRPTREGLRETWRDLEQSLRKMPVLYVPIARGGSPPALAHVRLRHAMIRNLFASLSRLGMVHESRQLIETARTMEHNPTRSESSLRRGILHNAAQAEDGSWAWRYDRRGHARSSGRGGSGSGQPPAVARRPASVSWPGCANPVRPGARPGQSAARRAGAGTSPVAFPGTGTLPPPDQSPVRDVLVMKRSKAASVSSLT